MPYNPGNTSRMRLSMLGAHYNGGLSYYSGSDPASFFPFVATDIMRNQHADFIYSDTTKERLANASPRGIDPNVSQWTDQVQGSFGRLWGAPGGAPVGNATNPFAYGDDAPRVFNGIPGMPGDPAMESGEYPEIYEKAKNPIGEIFGPKSNDAINEGIKSAPNSPLYPVVGAVGQFSSNIIVIVVGILLLAVAAYSIVVPRDARSAIIKGALA